MSETLFRVDSAGDVTVLSTVAELNARNSEDAKAFLRELIDSGSTRLVLDLSGTSFIDSSGLSALLYAMKAARNVGGELRLCALSAPIRSIFEITRLHKVFAIHADRGSAETAFG